METIRPSLCTRAVPRRLGLFAGLLVTMLAAAFLGRGVGSLLGRLDFAPEARRGEYVPTNRRLAGKELVLLYVGKASCAACQDPEMPALIRHAKRLVLGQSETLSLGFSAVGIGLDVDPFSSLRHLRGLGRFDELHVGRGWDNRVAVDLFHERFGARAETPQLILLQRMTARDTSYSPARLLVTEALVMRVAGVDGIRRWVRRRCPVPMLTQLR